MPTIPSYCLLNTQELSRLASLNASGSVFAVYGVLCSYARKAKSCFPSIKTISNALDGAYHKATIQRALKFLEDNKIIKRASRRSKERFQMTFRRAIQKIKQIVTDGHGEGRKDASQEQRKSAPIRKQIRRSNYKGKKRTSNFNIRPKIPTTEDFKEQMMAQYVLNGVIDDALPSMMTAIDWNWLENRHPIKAKDLKERISRVL